MKKHLFIITLLAICMLALPLVAQAAKNITSFDSTQPRGFGSNADPLHPGYCNGTKTYKNTADLLSSKFSGQDLCPIEGGIWTPFYYLGSPYDGQGSQEGYFWTWKGMMMGNGARDPAFFAMLSTVNKDQINLFNAAALACYPNYLRTQAPAGTPCDAVQKKLYSLLMDPGKSGFLPPALALDFIGLYTAPQSSPGGTLDPVIHVDLSKYPYVLQPEELLPVAADLCLRCHFTTDWLEGRSEPPTGTNTHSNYLKGQFWGAKFREYPGWPGEPTFLEGVPPDKYYTSIQPMDSEAGMEGIQCMYCHRQIDNFKRPSLYNGTTIPNGIGGYFVMQQDPYFSNSLIRPTSNFQRDPFLCGTCHDVTNPIIKEQNTTLTNNANNKYTYNQKMTSKTDYKHPIERTFTEWYWSSHGPGGGSGGGHCERCHLPMVFQGAQTWMIEGLDELWGAVDRKWGEDPYWYVSINPNITPTRTDAYFAAAQRSRDLLGSTSDSAKVSIEQASKSGSTATVKVRITNEAGHKLPTGFAEGRQMWINIVAEDSRGTPVFESGYQKAFLDSHGETIQGLARFEKMVYGQPVSLTEPIKVYEHVSLAKNYDPFTLPDMNGCANWNILDYTTGDPETGVEFQADCAVSHFDKEFHFVLLNYVEKDNRIPPKGWVPKAYEADGAFVVTDSMPDYGLYKDSSGSPINYSDTTYSFDVSRASGDVSVEVKVMYQTFNEHFMEYLENVDEEKMVRFGGRSRNAPCQSYQPTDGSDYACNFETWGDILYDIWKGKDFGKPAQIGNTASATVRDGSSCTPTGISEAVCNGVDDDCDGQIDENFVPSTTTCGIGGCARTGQTTCTNGVPGNTCLPGTPVAEICTDTIDNDCDGIVNDGCPVVCSSYTTQSQCTAAGCNWDSRRNRCR